MSSTKALVGSAAIVLALSATVVSHQNDNYNRAAWALSAVERNTAGLRTEVHGAQVQADQAEEDIANLKTSVSRLAAEAEQKKSAADGNSEAKKRGAAFLKMHPEFKDALLASLRSEVLREYKDLFRQLKLSSEEIGRFAELAMGRHQTYNVGPDTFELHERNAAGGWEQPMRAFLGEDRWKQYSEFDRTQEAVTVKEELAQAVYYSATPLSAAQGDELTRISTAILGKQGDDDHPPSVHDAANWGTFLSKAQSFLTKEQVEALESSHVEHLYFLAEREIAMAQTTK